MIRQATPASLMRNSWHRGPIEGMGLEWGIPSISPRCNRRSKNPASNLAPAENGGVFISPSNQTSGLSTEATTQLYVISDMSSIRFDFPERVWRKSSEEEIMSEDLRSLWAAGPGFSISA